MSNVILKNSLDSLIANYENEAKSLKCIASFRGIQDCPEKIKSELSHLEAMIKSIEDRAEKLDQFMDDELSSLLELEKLKAFTNEQENSVNQTLFHTPACFIKETSVDEAVKSDVLSSYQGNAIEEKEFMKIPFATRGRLTLGQINIAWVTMCKLFDEKYKSHAGGVLTPSISTIYISDTDIRNSPLNEAGSSTCKAILHTLRGLNLIKTIRQQKEQCYYKCV